MKQILLSAVLVLTFMSCKKSETKDDDLDPIVTPTTTPTQTGYNHESSLIGIWFEDSSQSEGGQISRTDTSFSPCFLDSMFIDSEHILRKTTKRDKLSGHYYYTKLTSITTNWEAKNDSLLLHSLNDGDVTNKYIYAKSGNSLELKLTNPKSSAKWVKYWYHKI